MTDFVATYEEFLNEGKVSVKRKYTENYPAKYVNTNGPIREKILSFLKEKGSVTYSEMMEFVKSINEETGGNTSRKWLNKNTKYFKVTEKNGVKTYKLSSFGEKVHNAIQKLNSI
jgi:hypothetical protein